MLVYLYTAPTVLAVPAMSWKLERLMAV